MNERAPRPFEAQTKHSGERRPRGGRRRGGDDSLVLITWRDIPAQVNGGSGESRVQRILPRRFQHAIDRAAMVAGKTQASEYVAEWQRKLLPASVGDPEEAAVAAAAEIEDKFPLERLNEYVKTGGWDPENLPADHDPASIDPTLDVGDTESDTEEESNG